MPVSFWKVSPQKGIQVYRNELWSGSEQGKTFFTRNNQKHSDVPNGNVIVQPGMVQPGIEPGYPSYMADALTTDHEI